MYTKDNFARKMRNDYVNIERGLRYWEKIERDAARRRAKRLKKAMRFVTHIVEEMVNEWTKKSTLPKRWWRRSPLSLSDSLVGKRILPVITAQDHRGKDVRVVLMSGLYEESACRTRFDSTDFSFTVRAEGDWIVVASITKHED